MLKQLASLRGHLLLSIFVATLVVCGAATPAASSMAAGQEERSGLPQAKAGLEITHPSNRGPHTIRVVAEGSTLVPRAVLRITNDQAAGDLTAVDMSYRTEGDSVRISLSVVYNDLSQQEWWKDKREKAIGSYLIHIGESIITGELREFGIDPFEIRVVSAERKLLKPGEDFAVTNKTSAIQVVSLETSLDFGLLTLKNASSRNIVSVKLSTGNGGMIIGTSIAPGASYRVPAGNVREIEAKGIGIDSVVFDDWTSEGDPRLGLGLQVKERGVRIQMPRVLALMTQALEFGDDELEAAFEKLEADLWVIPEAITKQDALDLLKSEFPALDDKLIASLYEDLKGGLYDARNAALTPIGELKRALSQDKSLDASEDQKHQRAQRIRERLTRLREDLESIGQGKRRLR